MSDDIQISGLAELRTRLTNLPKSVQGRTLQRALAAGAEVIVTDARTRAPQGKTGRLKNEIYSTRDKRASNDVRESRIITVRSGKKVRNRLGDLHDAYYWRWIEFGRAAVSRAKGSLGTPKAGFFGRTVKAYPAHPFLRPAFEIQKLNALEKIRLRLARVIASQSKRFGIAP